jgi:antitoxin MazE
MKARIQKWGNSLALRIPKAFATEVGLRSDSSVEISLVEGQIIIAPKRDSELTLDQLLEQITDDNLHDEIDFGHAVGREAW